MDIIGKQMDKFQTGLTGAENSCLPGMRFSHFQKTVQILGCIGIHGTAEIIDRQIADILFRQFVKRAFQSPVSVILQDVGNHRRTDQDRMSDPPGSDRQDDILRAGQFFG